MENMMYLVTKYTDFSKIGDYFSLHESIPSICIMKGKSNVGVKYSITIPTYKRADLLRETLDSCLAQSGYNNYDIIVVDNNPERNDETEILMKLYQGTSVSYYKNSQNLTMGGNWNRCAMLANGIWFVLLHDDDTISNDFLYEVDKVTSKKSHAGFIQTGKYSSPSQQHKIILRKYRKLSVIDAAFGAGIIGVPSGIVYKKEAYISTGGVPLDSKICYGYWLNTILIEKYDCYKILKELTFYRVSSVNSSNDTDIHSVWIFNDYGIITYALKYYHLPLFISTPFIAKYCKDMEEYIKKEWHSNFKFPNDICIKEYSRIQILISTSIVKLIYNFITFKNMLFS